MHVHAQEGIGLVVLQQDVILGRVLLDEVVLGDESVHLARADDIAKIGDVGEHRHHLRRLVAGLIKILLQPRFEALGFADVDDLSVLVQHQINAGILRHVFEFRLEVHEDIIPHP